MESLLSEGRTVPFGMDVAGQQENSEESDSSEPSSVSLHSGQIFGPAEEASADSVYNGLSNDMLHPGKVFGTAEEAFETYIRYAKKHGFSIRKQRTYVIEDGSKEIYRRDFVCHRAGKGKRKRMDDGNEGRNRKSVRCMCEAHLCVYRVKTAEAVTWQVSSFSDKHNHELLTEDEVRHLPAYRYISDYYKGRLVEMEKSGMSVKQMMRLLEVEQKVEVGGLPFNETDIRNFLSQSKNIERKYDAANLVLLCRSMQEKDAEFRYDYSVDEQNRLEHIAWCHASSVRGYEHYGDLVVFDTSNKLNAYDMIVGIWVGVTNHGVSCLFGCCLLRNEKASSFSWALKVFLRFMNGKHPKIIFTDQDSAIREAVREQMPGTRHAFCMWYITKKAPGWFSSLLGTRYNKWQEEFYKLNEAESEEDFDVGWRDMGEMYGLSGDLNWINLYELRALWAKPFLKSSFVGIWTTNRSESMNSFMKRFITSETLLTEFMEQVGRAVDTIVLAGEKQNMQQKVNKIVLKTGAPIEEHASKLLTPYAFNQYQKEILQSFFYRVQQIDNGEWLVKHASTEDKGCKVYHVVGGGVVSCSCRAFEFTGILCRHAVAVLQRNNCFGTPDQYLPVRWRREASMESNAYLERLKVLKPIAMELIKESAKSVSVFSTVLEVLTKTLNDAKSHGGSSSDHGDVGVEMTAIELCTNAPGD
ncbi:protein FAR1-RELATED SEQUENCE 11-like [Telopea speciosissima]|uniref:protein FAR1-RELATED SEQUENCE 11-like n=1 Tax=Telopea speciosissima TaxID=54955 RepID=UPI001CC81145|nr:protein FAR1-RELATED SEQUENCE 11-like [Telopea speciosissima]